MLNIEFYRRRKKELGITFEELSKRANLPLSTIYDIFRGVTRSPRIDTVAAIERALGLSPDLDATQEESANKKAPQGIPTGLTDDERVLVDYYRRLVPANKMTVFNLLKSVFKEASDLPLEIVSDYIGAYYN